MIGFNGGLIGGLPNARDTSTAPFVPGVWTIAEQRKAKLANTWPVSGLKLLDAYGGASVAYSLRLLRDAYTGPLVTVRRQDNNEEQGFTAEQIIGTGSGSLINFCSGTNGFVKTWHDQSGNGNNATQPTAANQPRIVSSASGSVELTNGRPCIRYFNSDKWLVFDTRRTDVISTFQVIKYDTTDGLRFLFGDTINADYHAGNTTFLDAGLAAAVVRNGAHRINNEPVILQTTNKSSYLSQLLISMINTGSTSVSQLTRDRTVSGRNHDGTLQEVVIYNTSQTSNVPGINGNINSHYSIYA